MYNVYNLGFTLPFGWLGRVKLYTTESVDICVQVGTIPLSGSTPWVKLRRTVYNVDKWVLLYTCLCGEIDRLG